jgi:superkiller protein 3
VRNDAPATSNGTAAPGQQDAADAELNLSLHAYQEGKYQEAILAAQAALKARPDFALAYNNLAVSYLQLHSYDQALQNAQKALQLQPDLELAKNNLVWIQQEKAKAAGAPLPAPPATGSADYYVNLSLQRYQAGQFQQSIDAARQALKIDPSLATAYNNIAAGYASMKMWDQAIENAQKALQLKPDMQLARNNLAWALNAKATDAAAKKK